jgi:hypothetical protein
MDNFKNLASDELIRNSLSEENKEFLIDNFNFIKDDDKKFVFYQNKEIPIRSIPRFKRYIAKEELYYNETSLDFEVTEGNITEFQRRKIEQLQNGHNFLSFKKINNDHYLKKKVYQEMRTEYERTYQIYGCVSYKKQIENENDFVTYWTQDHETFWEVFEEPCCISANGMTDKLLTYWTVDKIAGDSDFLKKYKEYVEQTIEQKQNEEKRAREEEKRRYKEKEMKRLRRINAERERRLKEEARKEEARKKKKKALEKARKKKEKALERARRKQEKEELERARKEEQELEEAQRKEEAKRKKEEKARRKKEGKARRKKEEKAREEAEKKELDKFFDEIAKENNNNNNNNNSTNDSVQKKNNKPKKKTKRCQKYSVTINNIGYTIRSGYPNSNEPNC